MFVEDWFPTKRNLPVVSMAVNTGVLPELNGDPESSVSAPVLESMEKAETSFDPELATYRNFSEVATARDMGLVPALNGDPEIAVNAPELESTVNADTLPPSRLAT